MENNNEIINEELHSGRYPWGDSSVTDGPKGLILSGVIGFAGGIVVTKVVVPAIKKIGEAIKLKKEHKELEDEVLDYTEVEFKED